MSTEHQHHSANENFKQRNMLVTIILNFTITALELIGGILSGSLALISDALHNLSDGISVIISYFALKISQKNRDRTMTYGYKRAEIIAALLNATVLFVIALYLIREGILRFLNPQEINAQMMIGIAFVGLIANSISVFLLHGGARDNINIKSAYVHLLADAFSSVGVILGGITILYFNVYWLDPLITVGIALYILRESINIIWKTIKILMQAVPENIDIEDIKQVVENLEQVEDIHHIHLWQTNDSDIHVEFHINVCENLKLSETKIIKEKIKHLLKEEFNIQHLTMQIEYKSCQNVGLIKED